MKKKIVSLVFVFALLLSPLIAKAQESSGQFGGGSVIIGYDNQTCVSGLSGAMRYNSSAGIEFCDGSSWTNAGGGCTAPSSCPNIGDVCTDGSQFAGFMLYGTSCEALYVTDNNQSTASQWKNATGTNDISTDSYTDGQINHANRSGTLTNFPAFDLCESNTYHSKSDWYLPAKTELALLERNQTAIDANAAGNFTVNDYWSSTEVNNNSAWAQNFSAGDQNYYTKTNSSDVRCVRRD